MIMSLAACAVILAAVYGVFARAIHLRNAATERASESRSRAHAAAVIRNDLRNGLVSGGKLAPELIGSQDGRASTFPGRLKFSATTARDTADLLAGDLQQIEYYVVANPDVTGRKAGLLVRTTDRNLLASTRELPVETPLLHGVESLAVSFFDGQSWASAWEVTTESPTLPQAVRVSIQQAAPEHGAAPPPIEILVPWNTQPEIAGATAVSTTAPPAAGQPPGGSR